MINNFSQAPLNKLRELNIEEEYPQFSSNTQLLTIFKFCTWFSPSGMICPITTEQITKTHQDRDELIRQWQTIFCIASGIHFFGVIFYAIFASGELQDWAAAAQHQQRAARCCVHGGKRHCAAPGSAKNIGCHDSMEKRGRLHDATPCQPPTVIFQ